MIHKTFSFLSGLAVFIFFSAKVSAQSSDFYAVDTIQKINIYFETDNWRFVLDSLRFNGEEMLEAKIEINGNIYQNVGVRIKRDRVFIPDQKKNSLFIRLDYKNEDQNYQGNRALMLSMSLRDPSMVREVLGLEIARKYMPAPKANYAQVMVNNDYYGLFVNIEPIDNSFLTRNFSYPNGHVYYSNPSGENKMDDGCVANANGNLLKESSMECYDKNFDLVKGNSFGPLSELANALNGEGDLKEVLNIDATLWMLAFNNVTANLASYSGKEAPNYFLYQDTDDRFTPIIWNTNYLFGSFKNIGKGSDLSENEMEKLDPLLHINEQKKPFINKLLTNDFNKMQYLSNMRVLLYDEFLSGKFEMRAKELQKMIEAPLIIDENRYYKNTDFDKSLVATIGKVTKIPGIVSFMNNRSRFLRKNSNFLTLPPEISSIQVQKRERYSRDRIDNYRIQLAVSAFTNKVTIYYRFADDEDFRSKEMTDDGKTYDEEAGDNIFGVVIRPKPGSEKLQYYIQAQNARSISYFPTRYMYEYEEIFLEELNK